MSEELHRDLGRHDAQIDELQRRVDGLHKDMGSVLLQLQAINKTLSEARGGWRMLLAVGGFASATTAIVIKALGFLWPK